MSDKDTSDSASSNTNILPQQIEYCSHCGMPFDFCDFGDLWHTGVCQAECIKRYPEIYGTEEATISQLEATTISNKRKIKVEKKVEQAIYIQRSTRSKRKVVTTIAGLHLFGIKLEAASKLFSKHFATGAGIVKGLPGQMDKIDIQGDVEDALVELLLETYAEIDEDKIKRLVPKIK